jgi:CPA2 family monovalent cation:H+ antiporter-2
VPEFPFLDLVLGEEVQFILNLGVAVAAGLIGGSIAVRLRQPAVLGYLLAGIAIGPFTPGFVGDVEEISVLADVGIVLLLFALGVEFSIHELRQIGRLAIPGAVAQILIILATGTVLGYGLGIDLTAALVVGACLSISSTVVVLKSLIDRGEIDSLHGRAAIGWSIVQDIATIVFIVSLPPLAGGEVLLPFALAIGKAAIFLAIAYVAGTRLLPRLFAAVASLGSNELFLLAVVATALLTAFVSSALFGLSLALGAFVAGVLVSESELSHQAAAEVTPFRDLFAVFFFLSVGMLLDPAALAPDLPIVAILVVIAVAGKGVVTGLLGRALGLPTRSAILLGATMAQVGEFSFIIAEDGLDLRIVDPRVYNIVLGTAVVTILLTPLVLVLADWLVARREAVGPLAGPAADLAAIERRSAVRSPEVRRAPGRMGAAPGRSEAVLSPDEAARRPGIVVLGAGRVGRLVIKAARTRGFRVVVVERDGRNLDEAARLGATVVFGDAANAEILRRLDLDRARVLVVAIGDPLTTRLATQRALAINPRLSVSARARGRRQIEPLRGLGVARLADPEVEAAFELTRHALQRMGVSGMELTGIVSGLRRDAYGPDVG